MKVKNLIAEKREEILKTAHKYGARNMRLFGSAARGRTSISSDVDFLVEMEPGSSLLDIVAIKQDLEDLLGCKVDVVTENALSPYIRDEILREAMSL
ncbi:MAG: nucleotidyltransferase family protein [Deltaproteobacteria bacterium]|nr:nucleotidyltransferase family protein [Deltaproteobacteria bacterium]